MAEIVSNYLKKIARKIKKKCVKSGSWLPSCHVCSLIATKLPLGVSFQFRLWNSGLSFLLDLMSLAKKDSAVQ